MLLPASLLLVVLLIMPIFEGKWLTVAVTSAAMVSGFILYPLLNLARDKGWCKFADLEFDYAHDFCGGASPRRYTIYSSGNLNYEDMQVDIHHNGITRSVSNSFEHSRGVNSCEFARGVPMGSRISVDTAYVEAPADYEETYDSYSKSNGVNGVRTALPVLPDDVIDAAELGTATGVAPVSSSTHHQLPATARNIPGAGMGGSGTL